jgi:hypothetical protein
MNGALLDGRPLRVNFAEEGPSHSEGSQGGIGPGRTSWAAKELSLLHKRNTLRDTPELTPERRAQIERLDLTQLSQLRAHLKSTRT